MKKSSALLACFALALSSLAAAPKDTSLKAQLDFENNYIYSSARRIRHEVTKAQI